MFMVPIIIIRVEIFSEEIFSSALPEPPSVHFMVFMYQHAETC